MLFNFTKRKYVYIFFLGFNFFYLYMCTKQLYLNMPRYTRRNRGGFELADISSLFGKTKKQKAAEKKKLEDEAKRAMEEAERVRKAEKLAKQLLRKKEFQKKVGIGALGVTALVGLIVTLSKKGYINIDSVKSLKKYLLGKKPSPNQLVIYKPSRKKSLPNQLMIRKPSRRKSSQRNSPHNKPNQLVIYKSRRKSSQLKLMDKAHNK